MFHRNGVCGNLRRSHSTVGYLNRLNGIIRQRFRVDAFLFQLAEIYGSGSDLLTRHSEIAQIVCIDESIVYMWGLLIAQNFLHINWIRFWFWLRLWLWFWF
ncbi:hypothetical protein D1872_260120 [compost metagenome]